MKANYLEIGREPNLVVSAACTINGALVALNANSHQLVMVCSPSGRLLGTVTDGDVRRAILDGISLDSSVLTIANRSPFVVDREMSKEAVEAIMVERRIKQIPVVNPERLLKGLLVWDRLLKPVRRDNPFVIMAGGLGTRLRPMTNDCPKPMLELDGRPILEHIVMRARAQGFHNFIFSVRYLSHVIKDYFGDGSRFGVTITYLEESAPLGTAGVLGLLTENQYDSPILMTNGDVISSVNYGEIIDYHLAHQSLVTVCVRTHETQIPFGVLKTEGVDVIDFQEKPRVSHLINTGIYVLESKTSGFIDEGEACDIPELLSRVAEQRGKITAYSIHESWIDIGSPDDYKNAKNQFKW